VYRGASEPDRAVPRSVGRHAGQRQVPGRHFSLREALGASAWARLPAAVRARFAADLAQAQYEGVFEVVRASRAGRLLALACRLIGTPVVPYTGVQVPATVRVYADGRGGVVWERLYRFPGRRPCRVRSTKRAGRGGAVIEALPCGLRMALEVFERHGALHFLSSGYFFSGCGLRLVLPRLLPPGRTHVEHIDEGGGWFRFSMTVSHPWLGEVFFQTGRFHAASEAL
jgi:Domain of unknown function (DUF4166)